MTNSNDAHQQWHNNPYNKLSKATGKYWSTYINEQAALMRICKLSANDVVLFTHIKESLFQLNMYEPKEVYYHLTSSELQSIFMWSPATIKKGLRE